MWSRSVIIEPGFSRDQSRQINHVAAGRSFGEGREVLPMYLATLCHNRTKRGRRVERGFCEGNLLRPFKSHSATAKNRRRPNFVPILDSRTPDIAD